MASFPNVEDGQGNLFKVINLCVEISLQAIWFLIHQGGYIYGTSLNLLTEWW